MNKPKKKTIKIKVLTRVDREKIVTGMINSGYKVWVDGERSKKFTRRVDYYVCFEVMEEG